MPFDPVFHSTNQVVERLRALDRSRPLILDQDLDVHGDPLTLQAHRRRVVDAVTYSARALGTEPSPEEVRRALGTLVRNIDHGGRLHAALTHAMGIAHSRNLDDPLPALPSDASAAQTRREAVVVSRGIDAVERAIEQFRVGVHAEPISIDQDPRTNAVFLGQVRAKQHVVDLLEAARQIVPGIRRRAAEVEDEYALDQSDCSFTPHQHEVLDQASRAFVTDLVRGWQRKLRTAPALADKPTAIAEYAARAMSELDVSKEPLRFVTAWVGDEHLAGAHEFIADLPSFRDDVMRPLYDRRALTDDLLVQHLRARAYPAEVFVDEAMHGQEQMSRRLRPVYRVIFSAGALAVHCKPELVPINTLRGIYASKYFLLYSIAAQLKYDQLVNAISKWVSRPIQLQIAKREVEPPAKPERLLYDALRAEP